MSTATRTFWEVYYDTLERDLAVGVCYVPNDAFRALVAENEPDEGTATLCEITGQLLLRDSGNTVLVHPMREYTTDPRVHDGGDLPRMPGERNE